jgi:uncharacterized membrane protein
MPTFRSPAMLRAMARGQMLGKYPFAAAVFVSVLMIYLLARFFLVILIDSGGSLGNIITTAVSFIISLIMGVFEVGILLMALKVCCNEPLLFEDLFYGFKKQLEKILIIQAIYAGASLLALWPGIFLLNISFESNNTELLPLVIALFAAGLTGYCYVWLILSQAFFLLIDFEGKSTKELLVMANLVMVGHKKRLSILWLSFIPLILLSLITCGIGFIWVLPFIKVAQANFYMDLMQNRSSSDKH